MVPEQTTLLTEFLTGGVDVFYRVPPEQIPRIVEDPSVDLLHEPGRAVTFVVWNARRPLLEDVRVRRAITMATDRASIVEALLHGRGVVANSGIPPFHFAFDADGASIGYNPSGAARLLEQAGWVDRDGDGVRENDGGEPLSIALSVQTGNLLRQTVAEVMQAQLAEVGIALRLDVMETSSLFALLMDTEARAYDGVLMGLTIDFRVDDTDLFHSARVDNPMAWSGTINPEIDRYLEVLGTTLDEDEARALWGQYEALIVDEQPYTFLYFLDLLLGVGERVRNVEMDARGEWQNIRAWYLDPESH
jgi:peptide/nickel transport system substrate-binding protein